MMALESQAPRWEWYYIAMYFYLGGVSAGAYFIGSLLELIGSERHRAISRAAYYLAFPLILVTPVLLITDLGRPERFWHLFFSPGAGMPYMNFTSPLSVGTWALLVYSAMSFVSFLNILVADGRLASPAMTKLHGLVNRIPHTAYAATGSFFGFFVAGYTGVLLNTTARPLWASTVPWIGPLFIVSAASTGAAAIALFLLWRGRSADTAVDSLKLFDRTALIAELALIVAMVALAGQFAAPLLSGGYGVMFLGGTVALGVIIPLGINLFLHGTAGAKASLVRISAVLVLIGGAALRISLVQAGQL